MGTLPRLSQSDVPILCYTSEINDEKKGQMKMCSDAGGGMSVPAFQKRQNWCITNSSVDGAHIKVQVPAVVAIAFSPDQLCDVF